jgi:hypothetical protein
MTNSKKVHLLKEKNFSLNPFTEQMFGEKTYHFHGWDDLGISPTIWQRNDAIIKQSELNLIKSSQELYDLMCVKLNINN